MSYDISWHRRKETVYDLDTGDVEESLHYDDGDIRVLEARELHSKLCGYLDFDLKPFEVEHTGLNITSNLYEMFSWAVNGDPESDWKIPLHKKTGSEIEPILRKAVERMENEPKKAKTFNSPNGWGTYPHALRFLKDLLAEAIHYTDAYLSINY